jgi:hypothetical protein
MPNPDLRRIDGREAVSASTWGGRFVVVVTLSHFASDLAQNHGSDWLTKILQFREVIPKSKNHRVIIRNTPVTGLTFCLVNTPEDVVFLLIPSHFF